MRTPQEFPLLPSRSIAALAASIVAFTVNFGTHAKEVINISGSAAYAKPHEESPWIEYGKIGDTHILTARGLDLAKLHNAASREFIEAIESEIKNPNQAFTVGFFKVNLRQENGQYVLQYSVRLTPTKRKEETHRLIAVRGTMCKGPEAEKRVKDSNKSKIPPWQDRMGRTYPKARLLYEVGEYALDTATGRVFVQDVLIKGAGNFETVPQPPVKDDGKNPCE